MPSRSELEQDLLIVEGERDAAEKRAHELARLRGENALIRQHAPDLEIPEGELEDRRELEVLRHGIDADLDALGELRNPSGSLLKQGPGESPADIVRANQRERAELQQRTAKASALLSRIAALVKLDRWDEEDGEILLGRLQAMVAFRGRIQRRLDEHKEQLNVDNGADQPAIRRHIAMLESILAMGIERVPVDLNSLRRIVFVVSGNDIVYHCQPTDTVDQARSIVLGVAYPPGSRMPCPADAWLVFDENGVPVPLDRPMRELALPTERIVITTPVGVGA